MFSPTMMASSTTMPSTRTKPNSDSTLIETSTPGISARAPRNEIGIPRLTQNARRSSRNSASTRNTSANPATPLRSISESWLFSDSASFCHTVSVTPSGRRARASSTYCMASSAISTALWSPVRKTETSIVGSKSKRAYWSVSSKPSTTVATSPSRRRLPSGRVHRTRSSNSAPRYACPMVRRRISPPSVRTDPPGRSSDERRTASATWSNVSPCRRRSFSGTSIEIS